MVAQAPQADRRLSIEITPPWWGGLLGIRTAAPAASAGGIFSIGIFNFFALGIVFMDSKKTITVAQTTPAITNKSANSTNINSAITLL